MNRAGRAGVRRSSLALAAILLLTAGCSDDDPPPRSQASIPGATAAPSTTNPDPYAVPPVIDEAYINRVLAAHDAVMAEAVRSVVAARSLTSEAVQRMQAMFSGATLAEQTNLLQEDAEAGFPGYLPDPGPVHSKVTKVVSADANCIFVGVARDYSAVAANPSAAVRDQYVALKRLQDRDDPHDFNPTPWITVYDGFMKDRSQPRNPCTQP